MLVRNAFTGDFLEVAKMAKEWGDIVVEREAIYHIFIEHFGNTCFIAEDRGQMIGYLLGFRSQRYPEQAYVHQIQVAPGTRGNGVGRRLFNQFQSTVKDMGCTKIYAVTRPENKYCKFFHKGMGFNHVASDTFDVEGVKATKDYNGPGKHMVVWCKEI